MILQVSVFDQCWPEWTIYSSGNCLGWINGKQGKHLKKWQWEQQKSTASCGFSGSVQNPPGNPGPLMDQLINWNHIHLVSQCFPYPKRSHDIWYITISHCGRMKGCAFCFCSNSCKSESSWLPSAPQQLEKLTIGALLSLFPLVSATKKSNFRVSSLGRQMLSMFHVSLLSLSLRCRLRSVCVEHGQNYVAPWSSQWHPRQSNPVRLSCGSHHVETAEMQQPNHRPGLDPPRHDNWEGLEGSKWIVKHVECCYNSLGRKDITTLRASASCCFCTIPIPSQFCGFFYCSWLR